MDETIYVKLKVLFDFALEVWFSIYIHTLWMQTAKALVSLHIYKASLSPYFLTLQ